MEWSPGRRSFLFRPAREVFPGEREDAPRGASRDGEAASGNDLQERVREPDGLAASALRPRRLADFVGQRRLVSNLELAIEAARARGEPLGHLLLGGPPGLGKTTLARLVAGAMEARFHAAAGPHLEEPQQLIGLLAGLGAGGVLFIDEVHGLPKPCEECLHSALEDGVIDVVVTDGSRSRTVRIVLAPFTLIGATTELGALAEPFRARFKLQETVEFYGQEDLACLVERAAPRLDVSVSPPAAAGIARRARRTPREALRLLERARDVATVAGRMAVEARDVEEAAGRLGIDADGLGPDDRRILALLLSSARPLGLEAMAAALRMDRLTLKLVHEPYLVEQGYVHRGPRGREAGARARARLVPSLEGGGRPRPAALPLTRNGERPQAPGIPFLGSLRDISVGRLGRGPAGA
jgi:Holliday junction DNA helicase RuvB